MTRHGCVEPLRTPESILTLLAQQSGRCAVCADELVIRPNAADALTGVVDRDSATHAVRGLVCHRCHEGLTRFGANPTLLRQAADYLDAEAGPLIERPPSSGEMAQGTVHPVASFLTADRNRPGGADGRALGTGEQEFWDSTGK